MQRNIVDQDYDVIYCEADTCTNLKTSVQSDMFVFNHPEADTMLFAAYAKLRSDNYTGAVVIDSADIDVYVQAAFVAHQVKGNLFIKRKRELIDCKRMTTKELSNIIIPLHVISGNDHTSAFYGHGKKIVFQRALECNGQRLLKNVGSSLELSEKVKKEMERFVFTIIYREDEDSTCRQARASMWQKLKHKSMLRLPPDEDSLHLHLQRTNYITFCQKNIICFFTPHRLDMDGKP